MPINSFKKRRKKNPPKTRASAHSFIPLLAATAHRIQRGDDVVLGYFRPSHSVQIPSDALRDNCRLSCRSGSACWRPPSVSFSSVGRSRARSLAQSCGCMPEPADEQPHPCELAFCNECGKRRTCSSQRPTAHQQQLCL